MKICLLNDSFPPVIDGVANVVVNYAGHLRDEHGARVIVGTPGYPGAAYDDYPYPVVPYRSFAIHAAAGGYRAGDPFEERSVAALRAGENDLRLVVTGSLANRYGKEKVWYGLKG